MSPLQSLLHPASADMQMLLIGVVLLGVLIFAGQRTYKLLKRHTRKARKYAAMYASMAAVSGGGFINIGGVPEQLGSLIGL